MNDIDGMLARLAQAPLPAALGELEARVLGRLALRGAPRTGVGVGAITVAAALALGMTSAGLAQASAAAASPLSPFGASSALAPSTLLAGTP